MYTVDVSGNRVLIGIDKLHISILMFAHGAKISWYHGDKLVISVLNRVHGDLQYYMWAGGSSVLYDSTILVVETRDFTIEWDKISGKVAKTFKGRRKELQATYTAHSHPKFMDIHSMYFR
jgi:hypothetical protein